MLTLLKVDAKELPGRCMTCSEKGVVERRGGIDKEETEGVHGFKEEYGERCIKWNM